MKELVEAIRTYGKGIGTDIVKVDMFLNHRLDTNLLVKMGQAFADVFACEKPRGQRHRRGADHGHGLREHSRGLRQKEQHPQCDRRRI